MSHRPLNTIASSLLPILVIAVWPGPEALAFIPGAHKGKATPTHTPEQMNPPQTPMQFNPDPGGVLTPAAKPKPKLRPIPQMPNTPPPEPKAIGGTPFDIGLPQSGTPFAGLPELPDRPSLFGDDFLYIPRIDQEPIPGNLRLPRRGVRSQSQQPGIFHYREYPMGQEGLGALPGTEPLINRWAIPFPKWQRYLDPRHETPYGDGRETLKMWHPYEQSKLKGDAPIIGQDIFANITAKSFSLFEYRRLPVPSGISAATPNSSEFFGRGEQWLISTDRSLTFEIFKGETTFKPVEWLFRFQLVKNDNWIWVQEQNLLDPDPRGVNQASGKEPKTAKIGALPKSKSGTNPDAGRGVRPLTVETTPGDLFNYIAPQLQPLGASQKLVPVDTVTNEPKNGKKGKNNRDHQKDTARTRNTYRHKDFIGIQELFFEYHLGDLSDNYDFWTSRVGIQPFVSDFRGFIFNDTNLGARLFGNWDNNHWQYNLAYFNLREKDTYSGLNMFDSRDQQVVIANVYRQDLLWKGYTGQASLHMNFDDGQTHFDKNDSLVRPAPLGDFGNAREHDVRTVYLGWAGDGHIGRWNINHAFYWALGEDEFNGLAGQRIQVNAQMAALELSYDRDWLRFKLSGFWASGDNDPTDDRGTGFDSIVDAPSFVGGPFSYYVHEGLNLAGTAVNLKNPDSLLPNLRSGKGEGQSNFVNPGVKILGVGMDADVTPKLRAFFNANYIWFDQTAPIERALHTNKASDRLGWDISAGVKYRPLLTENVIIGAGLGLFIPDEGYKDIYRRSTDQIPGFGPQSREGAVDDYLWNALLTVSFTF
jgi:hypothetical protein